MKKLTKSTDKKLCGVCSGIAEYMDIDPSVARIGYAALTILSGGFPGVLLYVVMAFVMPDSNSKYLTK